MKIIPIVFAFDNNMEMPAGVAISSLLLNADKDTFYDIFILHAVDVDFSHSMINRLKEFFPHCNITFRIVEESFEGALEVRGITKAAYYRLLIPKLVPEYDKILYSDVDVIFRQDLSDFYETPLVDCLVAGVNTSSVLDIEQFKYIRKIGIDPSSGYINSGSLVINSRLLLKEDKLSVFMKHIEKQYLFQDQDIINIVCCNRIKFFPLSFNLTVNHYDAIVCDYKSSKTQLPENEKYLALKRGTIHYNGAKPWNEVCLNMDIWWDYYRKSIFFDEKFAYDFWYNQTYRIERMSLWKRVKQVARYFREGGRK